jgi:hypothetical protein
LNDELLFAFPSHFWPFSPSILQNQIVDLAVFFGLKLAEMEGMAAQTDPGRRCSAM